MAALFKIFFYLNVCLFLSFFSTSVFACSIAFLKSTLTRINDIVKQSDNKLKIQNTIIGNVSAVKTHPTKSFGLIVLNSEGKKIGIFKPLQTKDPFIVDSDPSQEVAAYRFCRSIGCRVVPKTKYAKLGRLKGSFQEFVEGESYWNLGEGLREVYLEALKNPNSSLRQDFDEMVALDLIGGVKDRHDNNYLIDINKGRIHAIDNSQLFFHTVGRPITINEVYWINDAKNAPVSNRTREIIMQTDFSQVKHLFPLFRSSGLSRTAIRQRINQLQSILQENPNITLEDLLIKIGDIIYADKA